MKKRFIFIVNSCILVGIITLSILYLTKNQRDFASTKTMSFLAMTKSIAQITSNYINGEQLACDTWTNYINRSRIYFIKKSL